jgi:AmmeMemoRadiSam system protein A
MDPNLGDLAQVEAARDEILVCARAALEAATKGLAQPQIEPSWADNPILQLRRGVFVTLEKRGALRGCIGDLNNRLPLLEGVPMCAVKAGLEDPRFPPVTAAELPHLAISVSILTPPEPVGAAGVERAAALVPHRDGVILVCSGRRSTFLPRVWQQYPDPGDFLSQLCLKQGAAAGSWTDPAAELFRYRALELKEARAPADEDR